MKCGLSLSTSAFDAHVQALEGLLHAVAEPLDLGELGRAARVGGIVLTERAEGEVYPEGFVPRFAPFDTLAAARVLGTAQEGVFLDPAGRTFAVGAGPLTHEVVMIGPSWAGLSGCEVQPGPPGWALKLGSGAWERHPLGFLVVTEAR